MKSWKINKLIVWHNLCMAFHGAGFRPVGIMEYFDMRFGLALAASALLATGAQAVTVINGSFEQGGPIGASGQLFVPTTPVATSPVTGWTILSTGVDYVSSIGTSGWAAANGSRSIELAGISSGGIQQRLVNQFVVGKTYVMRFKLSANPFAPDGTYGVRVSATGGGSQAFTYNKTNFNTPTNMLYQTYQYVWVATNVSSNVQFRSTTDRDQGVVLDSVSISLVPEPAQWMLLIAGFGMTGFAMRRRRMRSVAA